MPDPLLPPFPRPGDPDLAPGLGSAYRAAREHAARADADRTLPGPVVDALVEAGFARHFVPAEHGGDAGTFTDHLHRAALVAEGCASAGWCASLLSSHARLATFLPPEGQKTLWAQGPDARISAGVVPSPGAEVSRSDGGWVLSGQWNFVSGVDFADWILLAAWEQEQGRPRLRFFAVPRSECRIEDNWFTVGMRGTGSKRVVVESVAVPASLSFLQADLLHPDRPGAPPFRLVNGLAMVAPALGAARGALDHWAAWISTKTEMVMGAPVQARDKGSVQRAMVRASSAIDVVELLMGRTAAIADLGLPVDDGTVARGHRDYGVSAEALADAVETVMRASGARGQDETSPVTRAWRDVHAATSHAALQFDGNAAVYVRHALDPQEKTP
ncbi:MULTISPECIES: hydrolase [unclassified Nocardiopsis]|uniref:hydrolase n=1 Tax=Nocardiopsis TaxID=2013 RepID=UPI00387AEFB5